MSDPTSNVTVIGGSAAALVDSLPIQSGRIVTRRMLKAPGARLVLMGLDAQEELTEHTAAVPVLIQVVAGRATITADGQATELTAGGMIRVERRVPHAVVAHDPTHVLLTLLDGAHEPETQ